MKKLIEFYPCPNCSQNVFEIWFDMEKTKTTGKPYLRLESNIFITIINEKPAREYFLCNKCSQVIFYEKFQFDNRQNVFVQKIEDFIRKHPEKIDKKFKEIWGKFLKQEIKSRLKEINS